VYEYIVTGRKNVGDRGQSGETNALQMEQAGGGLYHVDIEDKPNQPIGYDS